MDRQPLTVALAWLAAGCATPPLYEGGFELPLAAAVLQPELGTPFSEPVGFVANANSGTINVLALKQGRFLTDDPTASFLRGHALPTGSARLLSGVAVRAASRYQIQVFATDRAFRQLVRLDYVDGVDDGRCNLGGVASERRCELDADCAESEACLGFPREPGARLAGVEVLDALGQVHDRVRVDQVEIKTGYTTTETFVATFTERGWTVEGSRTGPDPRPFWPGERYVAERRAVAFRLLGNPQLGDQVRLRTDNGLVEADLPGVPVALSLAPDQSRLAVSVADPDQGLETLLWVDPNTLEEIPPRPLPDTSAAGRHAWSEDGQHLYVADGRSAAVWQVPVAGGLGVPLPTPWPVLDVAPLESDSQRLLFLVPVDATEIWAMDLDTFRLVDLNPYLPGEQGLPMPSAVNGIEAIPMVHDYASLTDDNVRRRGRSLAISLYEGRVVFLEEDTLCLSPDLLGPRTATSTSLGTTLDFTTNFEGVPLAATLEQNEANTRHVLVNPCAGMAPSETWTLRYDRNLQGWEVEGQVSGLQPTLAREDERYLSDNGAVSFVVRSGGTPSQDGWTISFSILDGALSADGDNDGDGIREFGFGNPGDPVFFHYTVGPRDSGWAKIDRRALVLVPIQSSNTVARVDPAEGDIDVDWK